jgi:hypothetical protein
MDILAQSKTGPKLLLLNHLLTRYHRVHPPNLKLLVRSLLPQISMSSNLFLSAASSQPRPPTPPTTHVPHPTQKNRLSASKDIGGLPSPPSSGSPSSRLAGLETSHDPWFDTFHQDQNRYKTLSGPHTGHFVRQRKMDLENSIGLEGSWRAEHEVSSGDKRDSMVWEEHSARVGGTGTGLVQRGSGSQSVQPVNPVGEGSGSATGLFPTILNETRREVLREKRENERRPMPTAVWADLMDTSKGRDKVLVRLHLPAIPLVGGTVGAVEDRRRMSAR